VDGTCGTYGEEERCTQGFWWGSLREGVYLEDLGIDKKIILESILKELGWKGIEWIDLAYYRVKW
jgi:hypothetical protein